MTNEPTLQAIDAILDAIGCDAQHQPKGQGWHRCYMHLRQLDGVPVSLGRVMFRFGKFTHIKWYVSPQNGELIHWHLHYFNFLLYTHLGELLDAPAWADLVERSNDLAKERRQHKLQKRAELPTHRPDGKKISRRPIAPPNPCRAALDIVWDYINEAKEHEQCSKHLHATRHNESR